MSRGALVRIGLVLLAALGVWWLLTATEWVEVEVDQPPRGEVARNRLFVAEQLLQRLGTRVERRTDLEALPPAGARLLLESHHWDLFPERAGRLRRWVEDGGHLVLRASMVEDEEIEEWIPVDQHPRQRVTPGGPDGPKRQPTPPSCRSLPTNVPDAGAIRLCGARYHRLLYPREGQPALWAVLDGDGAELLRVPVGRGTVTVIAPWNLASNTELLRTNSDHAYAFASALQAAPGATVWVVAEESRLGFLKWLWQQGWIALLLALVALAAWAWRSAVRFGPLAGAAPAERRSMREQVEGTGEFLRHHAPAALHAAQLRALQEAARARLPGADRMGRPALAEAIARATGVRAGDLERAMQLRAAHFVAVDLELLELARRRLAAPPPHQPANPP